jgi:integrase
MASKTLTAQLLLNLKSPASGFVELHDRAARGLSLRVFASGRKSWAFRYRPKDGGGRRRIALGDFPTVLLAEARRRADRMRGIVSDGGDPQKERQGRREAPTLGELIDCYLAEHAQPKKKPRTVELYTHYLRNKVGQALHRKKAHEVSPADIDRLHRRLGEEGKHATANRVVVTLSGVYSFARKRGLILDDARNPCRSIEKFRERRRERYLTGEELGRLGQALRIAEARGLPWPKELLVKSKHGRKPENRCTQFTPHVAAAFRLLLFTGCRLREILHLRWADVHLDRGLLLLPDSKESGEEAYKAVVLNAPALEVLSKLPQLGEFVVLGDHPQRPRADLQRPWELLRHHAALEGVRIHDLRHTHASIGAGAGLGLPIIGKLLGHKHTETTERYAHLDADPLRRASDRIGAQLALALGDAPPRGSVHEVASLRR